MRDVRFDDARSGVGGDAAEPRHDGAGRVADEQRVERRDGKPEMDRPRPVDQPTYNLRVVVARLPRDLHGGELGGLVGDQRARREVADHQLYGCQGGRHREGHRECQSLVVVLPSAQPGDRVDGRDDEAGGHVDRDQEVPELVPERVGEQSSHHVDVGHLPADELYAAWCVHERVGGQDRDRAEQARRRQRKAKQEMRPRLEPLPTVEVDADEDRLEEEGKSFDRKADSHRGPEAGHQPGPQEAELEGKDGAGHGPDRELDRHHHGPPAGDLEGDRVFSRQADAFHQQGQRGKGHPQRHEQDVGRECERHLYAAWQESRLARQPERRCHTVKPMLAPTVVYKRKGCGRGQVRSHHRRSQVPEAQHARGMRGMPGERRSLGPLAALPRVRTRGLLRFIAESPHHQALSQDESPRHRVVRAGRSVGLVLRGRGLFRNGRERPLRLAVA